MNVVRTMSLIAAIGAVASAGIFWPAQGLAAEKSIGVAATVKNEVRSVIRGAASPLAAGNSVHQGEIVQTGEASNAELLFLDQTNLSVGPKSEVKLDKFIYDPNKGTGKVVLEATRGAFRFVTGSQDPQNYSIKTPVATIGVRGTINHFQLDPKKFKLVHEEGITLIMLPDGSVIELTDAGTSFTLLADGTRIGPEAAREVPEGGPAENVADWMHDLDGPDPVKIGPPSAGNYIVPLPGQ